MNGKDKVIESIKDSLRLAMEESARLREVVEKLEGALKAAERQSAGHSDKSTESASTPEASLAAVIQIIRSNGGPMRRKEIAERAFNKGLIRSTRGQAGVDAIVGNVLSRNEPRLFSNTGWGWWSLARKAEPESEVTDPIRFPRVG